MNAAPCPDPDASDTLGKSAAPTAPVSQRGTLNRRKVLAAAVQVIDDDGLRDFTMKRVAERFGVDAMALYHYVHNREDMLDGIVEFVIDDLYGDPDVHMNTDDWRDYLIGLAHGVRRIALAHPQVFPLIATRPAAAPWIRPPLRSLRWMESFLDALSRSNFDDEASVAAYRAFSSFLLGHLLLEVSNLGADTGPVEQHAPATPDSPDLAGYPNLQRLQPQLSADRPAEEFEQSLNNLIDRLNTYAHH